MNKKFAALDLGNRWTGIATADPAGIVTTPHSTVETKNLIDFLEKFIKNESIGTIIIGLPITVRNTESEQTKIVQNMADLLKETFNSIKFILFDERYTSQHAESIKPIKSKNDKLQSHAIAAAIILSDYLESTRNYF